METTFITIHDTSPQANIHYASSSIIDVLGYQAHEVVGKPWFDLLHPHDKPYVLKSHSDGIAQDKAAVISYARILNSLGDFITCECVFTVVYNVLVACTSIYKQNARNRIRMTQSEVVQQRFSKIPKDPRYHMLQHLTPKFESDPLPSQREKRAALILNRFSRTSPVLFATDSISDIVGISPEQINGKSFYECIHQNCIPDAIRALEAAKANDSIAYMRFYYRDPTHPEDMDDQSPSSSDTDDGGGVAIRGQSMPGAYPGSDGPDVDMRYNSPDQAPGSLNANSRTSSETSDKQTVGSNTSMFYQQSRSSSSSVPPLNEQRQRAARGNRRSPRLANNQDVMLEAVISCSSDGLVVIIRRADPALAESPSSNMQMPQQDMQAQSLFAAPWGAQPIVPGYQPQHGFAFAEHHLPHVQALEAHAAVTNGPVQPAFMNAIREVAVFAWALTGINGNISNYARGTPHSPAVPPQGFPVWDRNAQNSNVEPPYNQAMHKWAELHARNTGAPAPPLPYSEQEHDPAQYERQNRLVRDQYQNPEGPDAQGSYARRHLAGYIGEDGQGSGIGRMGYRWTAGEVETQQHPDAYRQQEQQLYQQLDQQQGFGQGHNYAYQGPPIKQENAEYGSGVFNGMGQQQAPQQFGAVQSNGFGNRSNGNGIYHQNGNGNGTFNQNGNGNGFGMGHTNGNGMNNGNYAVSNENRSGPQGSGGNSMQASGSGSGSAGGQARETSSGSSPDRYLWF